MAGAFDHELIRANSLATLIESASKANNKHLDETRRWYRTWDRRLSISCDALKRQLGEAGRSKTAAAAREALDTIQRKRPETARQLGMHDASEVVSAEGSLADLSLADGPGQLWRQTLDCAGGISRYVVDEATGPITVAYRRVEVPWYQSRLPGALGLVLLLGIVYFGARHNILPALAWKWPQLIGVLVGLAWWLFLSPSLLGWAIVLASLLTAVRSGWQRKT